MKRYLVAAGLALSIVLLGKFVNVNFFKLDLASRITNKLFSDLNDFSKVDTTLVLLNSGTLTESELKIKIDTLLNFNPALIAINACDIENRTALEVFESNPKVVIAWCDKLPLSRIVYEDNTVTHFRSDKAQYFETRISNNWNAVTTRASEQERIHYEGLSSPYILDDLANLDNFLPHYFNNKIVLIGYMGDYVSGMDSYLAYSGDERILKGYKSARITPMNRYYGEQGASPDTYDIQISARIITMINRGNFINELGALGRSLIILSAAMLLVLVITLVRTRWMLLDIILYTVIYFAFVMAFTLLQVMAFDRNYYVEIPELNAVLLITGVFTIIYNLRARKKSAADA